MKLPDYGYIVKKKQDFPFVVTLFKFLNSNPGAPGVYGDPAATLNPRP